MQIQVGAGLVQQIDGLVRQETVGDIAFGEDDRLPRDLRRNLNPVEKLIVVRNAPQNGGGLFYARLRHGHRLETPFQRRILFDILAVLGKGRRAYHLNFPAGKRRLEDIRGAHGAFRVACAHQIMHLVNHEDDIPAGFDFGDQALHPALKLTAELRPRNEGGQIKEIDLLAAQLKRYVSRHDALGKSLRNGRLADARLTDQAGVILLAAVENLHHALCLHLAANNPVQFVVSCLCCQILTVGVEEFPLFGLRLFALSLFFLRLLLGGNLVLPAKQAVHMREGGRAAADVVLVVLLRLHHGHHFSVERVQILVGDAHTLYDLINLFDSHFLGAFEAQSLVCGLSVLHLRYKNHSQILFASAAQCRFHGFTPLLRKYITPAAKNLSQKIGHGIYSLASPVPARIAVPSLRTKALSAPLLSPLL